MSPSELAEFRDAIEELRRRENESLRLYEPMPEQEAFHGGFAPERLVLGGNRGGKTLCGCVEIARAVTGQDPYQKYDASDGRFIVVGKDLRHCAKVIYRKLFKHGAFKVIYDPISCRVRAYRPWQEWDKENADKAKSAPPLIPDRFYRPTSIAWDDRRAEVPSSIRIDATGWELNLFSGESDPPNGWDADAAAFDEEIPRPIWYTEVSARLLDRRRGVKDKRRFVNGRFFWMATPQAGTQHLYDLYERAEADKEKEEPSITSHSVSLLGNFHITDDAKKEFVAKLSTNEDEYNVRVKGEFAILGSKVYPEFMPRGAHGCRSFPVPHDWTRYMFLDPGRQVCAALFVALAPPHTIYVDTGDGLDPIYVRNKWVIYDELYIRRSSAAIFASKFKDKVGDHECYDWIIDMHAGRIHEMGSGYTVAEQFSMELKKLGCKNQRQSHHFTWGADDIDAGILAVRRGLHVREDGARWLVMADSVPNFLDEARKYCYKKQPGSGIVTDVPLQRDNHLMDCWRYCAAYGPTYRTPPERKRQKGYALEAMERKRKKGGKKGFIQCW